MKRIEATFKLTKSDWQELYYAVEGKATLIENGRYGPKNSDGVDDAAWCRQLRRLAKAIEKKIGIDNL